MSDRQIGTHFRIGAEVWCLVPRNAARRCYECRRPT